MTTTAPLPSLRHILVVLRGTSSATFKFGEVLWIEGRTPDEPLAIVFQTRYLDRGFSVPIPGDMVVEVRGIAPAVRSGVNTFANLALQPKHILAVTANAPIEDFEVELAYDNDPADQEHESLQNLVQPEPALPTRLERRIDVPATAAVLDALNGHAEADRMHRAINPLHSRSSSVALQAEAASFGLPLHSDGSAHAGGRT